MTLTRAIVEDAVSRALAEDAPWGDATVDALVPAAAVMRGRIVAREAGVLAGGDVARAVFRAVDPAIRCCVRLPDGSHFGAGEELAAVRGPARGILTGERVALNFLQRMCGVATLTARYVSAAEAGARAAGLARSPRIADTRKTTPGLRAFEKHSVRAGGGSNHRFGLSDAVMVKDNHMALLLREAAGDPERVTQALRDLRARVGHTVHIEVEVDQASQIGPVLAAGVDSILLDNFAPADLTRAVDRIAGRALVEASGGVTLSTVGAIAATGVDVISVGALTHSAPALDLGLDWQSGGDPAEAAP